MMEVATDHKRSPRFRLSLRDSKARGFAFQARGRNARRLAGPVLNMPLFSVIIPTFNRQKLLVEALDSVRRQSFRDFEVIVVDDGSTDDTSTTLARYADGWPDGPLRCFRQDNAGQGAARNLGISHASGEYCLFLDSDDLLLPWSLVTIAQAISIGKSPPLVLGLEHRFRDESEYARAQPKSLRFTLWPDLLFYSQLRTIRGAGETIARTALLREVGGFLTERIIGEDTDLLLRCGISSPMLRIDAPATYAYRMHGEMFTLGAAGYLGASALIARCRAGIYPGGVARLREFQTIVGRIGAYHAIRYLIAGDWRKYSSLCLKTLPWEFNFGNYRGILRMPVRTALGMFGKWPIRAKDRPDCARANRDRERLEADNRVID